MTPEIWALLKSAISALVGSAVTLAVIAKFGQSWFFKKIDARYAVDLAEKNNQLMSQLEHKKNDLNKELQIEVAHFKSQLDVLGSQQSKFLEVKINNILLLNQNHYLAIKKIKELTDVTNTVVEEATNYFKYQIEDREQEELSDYTVYRNIHQNRWPPFYKNATSALDKYAECLALNMPILPKELVEEAMLIIDRCRYLLSDTSMNFNRAMNFSQYIVFPEECQGTEAEYMASLIEEHEKSIGHKEHIDKLSNDLFNKALKSGALIESLLQHRSKG
ncbi:hypothetical protein [Pseudomonas fluorescens]|uniref:hypothetical protein n=1 Tax=Pseudomonas fluorescens TaxID=294 RepID=UPI001256BCA4|nr:hypothetical protein [Pseudomonas fluorescens]VVN74639.1 hypothetical protein PS720_00649 [Pseudomonas fluorescens]